METVRLKIERRSSHPWIFQKMVERPTRKIEPGSIVDIVDRNNQWIGRGVYNHNSRITLRVLTTFQDEAVDAEFFRNRLLRAIDFRTDLLRLDNCSNAYRLVHSEGDELSGLVIDRFDSSLAIEYFSLGMYRQRELIKEILQTRFPGTTIHEIADEHTQEHEGFFASFTETISKATITENGVRFRVFPGSKHKTGFFTDQRDNRAYLASLCHDKKVLDLCCNSGGFGVYAKSIGKAKEVQGVDLDEEVIAQAKTNANLNSVQIKFTQADIFAWLRDVLPHGQRWDIVVLDPAKMTRDRDGVEQAVKKYTDMNRLAIQAVEPGGIFVTCSCTGLVSEDMFAESVRRAAWQAGKQLQIFHTSGAGADHPYLAHVQESKYLKVIWGRVTEISKPSFLGNEPTRSQP
ncbi:MAG: class I SAM-dependent rRNA methyltransferase [Zavarzinella sp.]